MGKYVISQAKKGWKFALKAGNGAIIAVSEIYETEKACMKGIESIKKNAPIAKIDDQTIEPLAKVANPKFEIFLDKKKEFRFSLKAKNGEIIAASEGYKAKQGCENGIASVVQNSDAEIKKE